MRHELLIKNIMDQIKEAQIKLGFAKETVRLYYPLSTLNSMLATHTLDIQEMMAVLESDVFQKTELGALKFSSHKQRIEVSIPPEGAEYVHDHIKDPLFLMDLIDLFRKNHHCTLQDIKNLFETYSKDYVCQKMPEGSDFDVVLYFEDPKIDAYYYCIKDEMGHTIYHRFTREDMVELLKDV